MGFFDQLVYSEAKKGDAQEVADLFRTVYGSDYGYPALLTTQGAEQMIGDPKLDLYLVRDQGKLIGTYGLIDHSKGKSGADVVEFGRTVIHPEYRGIKGESGQSLFKQMIYNRMDTLHLDRRIRFTEAVTSAPHTLATYGNCLDFIPLVVATGIVGNTYKREDITTKEGQMEYRETIVYMFDPTSKPFIDDINSPEKKVVFLPESAHQLAQFNLQKLGMSNTRELRTANLDDSQQRYVINTIADNPKYKSRSFQIKPSQEGKSIDEIIESIVSDETGRIYTQVEVPMIGIDGTLTSRKLMQKGYELTGYVPNAHVINGSRVDTLFFEKLSPPYTRQRLLGSINFPRGKVTQKLKELLDEVDDGTRIY